MNIPNLTVAQLEAACRANRFIIARYRHGTSVGINCAIAPIALKKKEYDRDDYTSIISFKPCGLNEYINRKINF